MNAYSQNQELASDAERRGVQITNDQAAILRRAELTLHRWSEEMCGSVGNKWYSRYLERGDDDGKPFHRAVNHYSGKEFITSAPDRERGALKRVASLCDEAGIHFYHQTDPRGAALYVSADVLTDQNYTNGICCAIR